MKRLSLLIYFLLCAIVLPAQDDQALSPIIFIYDASGSMWGQMQGKTKMAIAANVLSNAVNELPENQQVGLVAYGHRKKGDCQDVEFLVDVSNRDKATVTQSLKAIKPLGKTPLAYSATQVIDKLRASKVKATIILVTDGIESCNGDICDVIAKAKAEGIDFKLHIIGFGLKEGETAELKCAAEAGDGQYYDAAGAGALGDVLNDATASTVDKDQPNVTVYAVKNGKAIDAAVHAYKPGEEARSIGGARSYQDTAKFYVPAGTYDIKIRPLAGSSVQPATLANVVVGTEGITHRDVSFDGGKLTVSTKNNEEGWDAVVKMIDTTTGKVVASTRTYGRSSTMEVNPGIYDIKFQALRMEGLETKYKTENVKINAGETKELEHIFKSGIAMIGAKSGSELVDATVRITDASSGASIATARTYTSDTNNPKKFILNPGTYSVKMLTLGKHKGNTKTFEITVKQGETVEKIINF